MAIYNREDPRTALPQLEKQFNARFDGLLDFFYPVGCFFETSDVEFDPNKSWGGKWELEDEGLVHIGAGETYTAGGTGGATSHYHTTQGHTLTASEIPYHSHGIPYDYWTVSTGSGTQRQCLNINAGSWSYAKYTESQNSGSYGASHSHGDTGNGSNMQPYVVVNRWHRIS